MPYQVKFTDALDYTKPVILVDDQLLNNQTSLTLVGRNYTGYSQIFSENFVHLLENFSNATPPLNPIEGQLWYDKSTNAVGFKFYTGSFWKEVGGVSKSTSPPQNAVLGDIWVDLVTLQAKLFSGNTWELIGPASSSLGTTGVKPEVLTDINSIVHNIVSVYSNNTRVAIISDSAFVPNGYVAGFSSVGCGITLSMIVAAKLTGTATKAESLVDGNSTLAASAIVRTNVENTIRYALNIAHNSGISIGGELGFSLGVTATSNEISSLLNDVSLDIKTRTNNETTILMRFDASTKRVGIGTTTPEELLHVGGNAQIDGQLIIDSTSSNSIATAGGVEIGGNAVIGGTVALAGQLLIGPLNSGVPVPEAIMPTVTDVYDQGSPTRRYRNIYADTFVGDRFVGDLEGNLLGVALSASTLASVTEFGIVGDVTCTPVNFNGAQSQVTFTTELTNNVIIGKEATSVSYSNDRLLIFRNAGGDIGLRSISKATLTSNLATVPVGTILAYGGMVPPTGYAFCDGGELRIANFPTLFSVIGYSYKAQELLSSVEMFGLPFLNGRIPIGRDNMGGQAAHNITGIAGSTLGGTGGSESVSLVEGNMPSHSHSIDSFTEEMHFANGSGVAALARSADTEQTSSIGTGTPFVTLPPYQVVNYIIYTGVM